MPSSHSRARDTSPAPSITSTGRPYARAKSTVASVPLLGSSPPGDTMRVAWESRTFHAVRWMYPALGVSLSSG